MKTIIAFFVAIFSWIARLFKSNKKKPVESKKETLSYKLEKREQSKRINHSLTPPHNNRKNTRGRRTQHLTYMGKGKAIYHSIPRTGSSRNV